MMMTNNMKAKHSLAVFGLLCTLNMACTDTWNEHYDTAVADSGTLWQKISDPQGNTQQFARVLEACGYKEVLDGSQTYTVFAPADDTFSAQQADSVIALYNSEKAAGQTDADNKAVKQFVQNHIALYSHPVSSLTNDTLTLMNRKYYPLSSQKLGGCTLTSAARLCNNGLLFTLSGKLNYFPNIFEYLGQDSETDSAYQFFRRYSIYEFDETKSVVGDVIDGRTIYLDSVSTLTNRLFDIYGRINSEDSIYWMLCPSNDEWNRLVSEYSPYFNYPNNVAKRDSLVYTHTRLAFMGGTIFSASRNTEKSLQDSAVSTMAQSELIRSLLDTEPYYIYYKPYGDGGVFSGTQDVACSNGHVLKARQFGVSMYDTFMQTVKVEAENLASQDNLVDAIDPVTIHQVTTSNPFYGKVSGNSFVEIKPSTPTSSVVVRYSVPNLLSGMKYDVMAVFVPATAADTLAREEAKKPCRVVSRVAQTDQNGKLSEPPLRNAKTTKAGVVDTVKMSTVTISTCSYGLTDALVKLDIKSNVQETQLSTYSNTLRLDCIIFKPVK